MAYPGFYSTPTNYQAGWHTDHKGVDDYSKLFLKINVILKKLIFNFNHKKYIKIFYLPNIMAVSFNSVV